MVPVYFTLSLTFLSTPSARRATSKFWFNCNPGSPISIHALREEGDNVLAQLFGVEQVFLSTPSARRATAARCRGPDLPCYFYPRPPRGGRRCQATA